MLFSFSLLNLDGACRRLAVAGNETGSKVQLQWEERGREGYTHTHRHSLPGHKHTQKIEVLTDYFPFKQLSSSKFKTPCISSTMRAESGSSIPRQDGLVSSG